MTARILLAAALVVVAALVAWVLDRRKQDRTARAGPLARPAAARPRTTSRGPTTPWLVVLWSSRTCDSCRGLFEKMAPLASDDVAVVEVEYQAEPDLHRRYAIEAAPVTIVVDAEGVTRASFAGAFTATDLWAEARRAPG